MQLTVVCTAFHKLFEGDIDEETDIDKFIEACIDSFKLPPKLEWSLVFQGEPLEGGRNFKSAGVAENDVIFLVKKTLPFGDFPSGVKSKRKQLLDKRILRATMFFPEVFLRAGLPVVDLVVNGFQATALLDTGAQVSVMPSYVVQRAGLSRMVDPRFETNAQGLGGEVTEAYGRLTLCLVKMEQFEMPGSFVIVKRRGAVILGADFIKKHKLIIDMARKLVTYKNYSMSIKLDRDYENNIFSKEVDDEEIAYRSERRVKRREHKQRIKGKKEERRKVYEERCEESRKRKQAAKQIKAMAEKKAKQKDEEDNESGEKSDPNTDSSSAPETDASEAEQSEK